MRQLLDGLCAEYRIEDQIAWYYTPMHIRFSRQFQPLVTVYDVMDELSAFKGAATRMLQVEEELLRRADLVFTGGPSLYEAKRSRHPDVHLFPSAVDHEHFARARGPIEEPEDQAAIARPRIGYFGVVDERIDFDLIDAVAGLRPDWQFVFVGPIVKVSDDSVPRGANIHWMEVRDYRTLPAYISGWDVAIMPFAHNDATRFISPTKGPEYLVAGRPVVSTSIRDVVEPYGRLGLVRIADDPDAFVAAIQAAMDEDATERRERADRFLADTSWDRTWQEMSGHISRVLARATDDARQVAR
jgi:glycosyltransferase involved in cell wall biosynthesis